MNPWCGQHKDYIAVCGNRQHHEPLADWERELLYGDRWGYADMWVTFTDGSQLCFNDIRIALRNDVTDPVKIDGTTVTVEDRNQTFTILGVRYFSWEHK